ncbi:MAG: hypothetical protein OXD30_03015 [Bryobacterales bacterium]|nr:hypothetical protein [Bryobacterales bacterium]
MLRLEERHFMGSDELSGGNAWKARTREEQVRGFPRVNYNEMIPAELPPTQHSPAGLFAVLDGDESARVRVRTNQGSFEFHVEDLTGGARSFLDGCALARFDGTA